MAAEEADKDEAELQPELLRQTQQVYLLCCCKACESLISRNRCLCVSL